MEGIGRVLGIDKFCGPAVQGGGCEVKSKTR